MGTSSLNLLQTKEDVSVIWNRRLLKPVKYAHFSYDAGLIASTGYYDSLVKIWRRQAFGSEDSRFDFTYLSHPAVVTGFHWKKDREGEHVINDVLYSICADKKVRIWAAMDLHGLQALQLWAEIDMLESIQPRLNKSPIPFDDRYAFFINSEDFRCVSQQLLTRKSENCGTKAHSLEHLFEIADKNPDICVVLDAKGHMSAWGLELTGCKVRTSTKQFNITHVDDFRLPVMPEAIEQEANVQFLTFNQGSKPLLSLLVHHFDGRIQWLDMEPDKLFDQSPRPDRIQEEALWTGHDDQIRKIIRNTSGRALISRTGANDGLIWKQRSKSPARMLNRASTLYCTEHIQRACLLQEGDFVVILHLSKITIWDARSPVATLADSCDYDIEGHPLCLILLPAPNKKTTAAFLATISSKMKGIAWEVQLPSGRRRTPDIPTRPTMRQYCRFQTEVQDDLTFVLPVDPAGSPSFTSGFLDTFARDIAVSYTDGGVLRTWTAAIDLGRSLVTWLVTATVETGILKPSLASTSSIRKSAVIDSSKVGLTIWDMSSGQLEYSVRYDGQDQIQDLDWSSTPDNQSILAVGFPHKVIILAQMRFDYLNAGPAWTPIREIHIKESTPHPIGDSVWLENGSLVIGAGNQLFVYDKVAATDDMITDLSIPVHEHAAMDLFKLVAFLNGPLPLFHPQFLGQCILAGKTILVQRIIIGLHNALRFFTSGEDLDSFLGLAPEDFFEEREVRCSRNSRETANNNRRIIILPEMMLIPILTFEKTMHLTSSQKT